MAVYVGLLRAIGPATHARMSMGALRNACEEAGLGRVSTYLTTGNVMFSANDHPSHVREVLQGVVGSFGLDNEVFLRTPKELAGIVAADPFPDAAQLRPSQLAVCFLSEPPAKRDWLDRYEGPERLMFVGQDLCVDYPLQISKSRLAPSVIERRLGLTLTARNWNTVGSLLAKARAFGN